MSTPPSLAIIGAGPYGLSVAAHLRARRIPFRIFGRPMAMWRDHMPEGMFLKSEGFASSLSDPDARFTLRRFCADHGLPYRDTGVPIPRDTFVAYALAFQNRLVPEVEEAKVVALDRSPHGFHLELEDGRPVAARAVVVAVGIGHFPQVPTALDHLPAEFVTHSTQHSNVDRFRGRDVTVIGVGASALDIAAELHDRGASVRIVARRTFIRFQPVPDPEPRPLWKRLTSPISPIGLGWRSQLVSSAPMMFYRLPQHVRLRTVQGYFRPTPGWYMRERVVGHIPVFLGCTLIQADVREDRLHVRLADERGATREFGTDHIISATGFKLDARRVPFFGERLLGQLRMVEHVPCLSTDFQSSVPGLYFVGPLSANNFGPTARFVVGADFAARRIARLLAGAASRTLMFSPATPGAS